MKASARDSHHQPADDSMLAGDQAQSELSNKKRPAMPKQQAFLEYKQDGGEGGLLERAIVEYRNELRDKKQHIKNVTQLINATKKEMDSVKVRLDAKAEEKKAQMRNGNDFQGGDYDDDIMAGGPNGG